MIWILLYGGAALGLVGGFVYLTTRIARFNSVFRIAGGHKKKAWMFSGIVLAIILSLFLWQLHFLNTVIIFLHLILFWLICDGVGKIGKKKRHKTGQVYFSGIFAILFTVVYLGISAYLACHVWETDYTLTTEKKVGSLKMAMIGDAHVGTVFDGDGFAEHMETLQQTHPDVVFVVGDLVDDDTSKTDMEKTCAALGRLKTTYGVYYVYGNHEAAYFSSEKRGYTLEDLTQCLMKNGVKVLCDETILIDDRFYVIGRQDKSNATRFDGRKTMSELTRGLDSEKYTIVLDHQPNDYEAQAQAGIDLVLSGHTHGGQMLPFNHIGEWLGLNDWSYGQFTQGKTHFIVTSGIGDWQLYFKSGCRSEFVVINLLQEVY